MARPELRPYQIDCIDRCREAFRHHRRVLLQSPTGSGKTVMFAWLTSQVAERGKRVLILVHRRKLLRQCSAKLDVFGVPHGIIAGGSNRVTRSPVAAASVQTLARRIEHYRETYDLIVVDEAHHAVAGQWAAVLDAFPHARILGVTATPERADGRGLRDAFDDLVLGPDVRDLIDQGHLSNYTMFCPPEGGPDLSSIRTKMGDYDLAQLAALMSGPGLVGDSVEHYRQHCDGAPAVAFCVSVKHAELVAEQFRAAGYRAVAAYGSLDQDECDRRIHGLETGAVQVLTSCDLISEGLDIPSIHAAILLRPTKSLALYLQQVGRALRPKPDRAIILDHAGNSTHGRPCQPRAWSLDAKKRGSKKAGVAPIRNCPQCYAIIPASQRECENCGHEIEIKPRDEIETRAGELVELKTELWGNDGRPTVERTKADISAALAKCNSLKEIQGLARALNYKPGWAWHQWQRRISSRHAA
jgi:DNA repair protein RadD